MSDRASHGRHHGLAAWLAAPGALAALAAAFTFVPWLHAHGLYLRDALYGAEGMPQWWRLVTAMWVHLDGRHWLGNTLAAAGLLWLIGRERRMREMLAVLVACGVAVQLALLAEPRIRWYGGLSGALHGLAAWGALRLIGARGGSGMIGVAMAVGLLIKLWLEQSWLVPVRMSASWGFGVVSIAHAYGAVAGLVCWLLGQWSGIRHRGHPDGGGHGA